TQKKCDCGMSGVEAHFTNCSRTRLSFGHRVKVEYLVWNLPNMPHTLKRTGVPSQHDDSSTQESTCAVDDISLPRISFFTCFYCYCRFSKQCNCCILIAVLVYEQVDRP